MGAQHFTAYSFNRCIRLLCGLGYQALSFILNNNQKINADTNLFLGSANNSLIRPHTYKFELSLWKHPFFTHYTIFELSKFGIFPSPPS